MPDKDEVLDRLALFVPGFIVKDADIDKALLVDWRKECRAFGRCEGAHLDHLLFSSPNVMVAFNQHATALPELMAQMLLVKGNETVQTPRSLLDCYL